MTPDPQGERHCGKWDQRQARRLRMLCENNLELYAPLP